MGQREIFYQLDFFDLQTAKKLQLIMLIDRAASLLKNAISVSRHESLLVLWKSDVSFS